MKTHANMPQGSKAWHQLRAEHFSASDAPAMMGKSSYKTRSELLSEKKLGITKDIDAATQKRFDLGHKYEAMARPFAEEIISDDLYPATGSEIIEGLPLSASFDGISMGNECWEHKTLNKKLSQVKSIDDLDIQYLIQMEHQMLVASSQKCLFMASTGEKESMVHFWYESNPKLRAEIIAGWHQFAADLETHEHIEEPTKPIAELVDSLPAVSIQVDGGIAIIDNLSAFGEALSGYVKQINKEPESDQDFANLESAVKTLKKAESALDAAENGALSQAESIDAMRKTVELHRDLARNNRLIIEKLVTAKKATIKANVVTDGKKALDDHIASLNTGLGGNYITDSYSNFATVIKGKRTITSIKGAVNDELARVKIIANEVAETIRANLKLISESPDYKFLFNDLNFIVTKAPDDFALLVDSRINEHKEAEAKKERDRIADEEAEKARIAKEAAEKEEVAEEESEKQEKPASDLSQSSQSFVNEMGGGEPEEPASEQTAPVDTKEKEADIKKLKKYFDRLATYQTPSVKDAQCSAILKKAIEKIIEMQDYVEKTFLG